MDYLIVASITFMFGYLIGLSSTTNNRPKQVKNYKSIKTERKEISIDQQFLAASSSNNYNKQYLLNKSEKKVYWLLVKYLKQKYCVNPQASLGEILRCENEIGYRAINSKRSDFIITDKSFNPLAVIEYQGSGHYQSNYEVRDKIKSNALSNAGIEYIQFKKTDEDYIFNKLVEGNFLK